MSTPPSSPRRPKLLLLINDSGYLRGHFFPLTKWAQEEGYEVVVATQFCDDQELFHRAGFRTAPLTLTRSSMNPFAEIATLAQVVRVLRREKPDVLEAVTIKPVLYGGLAACLTGTRSIIHFLPGLGFLFMSPSLPVRLMRPFFRLAVRLLVSRKNSALLVLNEDDARYLTGRAFAPGGRTEVVPGVGIDLERFPVLPDPDPPLIVACVSRMLWDKGIGELVEAARLLQTRGCPARIRLVGKPDPGNPTSIPEAQLHAWHREGLVEYHGFIEDLSAIWKSAHVCVLPSYREGLGMSLVEAAAFGRALIATDVPGCRAVVQHMETGLLVAPKSPKSLADAIELLANQDDLRRALGAAARRAVEERYSVPVVRAQLQRIYRHAAPRELGANPIANAAGSDH